jgi:hypothetical protein
MPHAHADSIALGPVGGTPRLAAAGPGVAYTCAESETKTSTRWPLSHMCRSVLRLAVLDMPAGLVPRATSLTQRCCCDVSQPLGRLTLAATTRLTRCEGAASEFNKR